MEHPASLVPIPGSWSANKDLKLQSERIASYRIVLKNCPEEEALLVYIPSNQPSYRAYINGTLVSSYGAMEGIAPYTDTSCMKRYQGVEIKGGEDAELIIEISNPHKRGLYKVPVLIEAEARHVRGDNSRLALAVVVGILSVAISGIAVLTMMRDRLLSSYALLLIDVVIFIRILFQNNYIPYLNQLFTEWEFYVGIAFRIIMLFLPIVFLYCVNQLVHIKISNRQIHAIAVFEAFCVPLIIWGAESGRPGLFFLMGIISYLPFLYVMWIMYQGVRQNVDYSLEVTAVLMFVISSILITALDDTGWLIVEVNFYPAVSFMISVLLQLAIFFRRSVEVQHKAIEAENLRLKLKESESDLMLSQIKPHFLYNTLIVIHMLCTTEPETAAETVLKFSSFLRTNLNFTSKNQLNTFDKELVHIQNYVDIEKLRHKDRLTVKYEIETTCFMVPVLCIQPLVENAIRHGACKNIKGGTVILRSRETKEHVMIEVMDDGPGFDPEILKQPFEAAHGLYNIKFRLMAQFGAEITIDSSPETGTCVTVKLPKEAKYEDDFAG